MVILKFAMVIMVLYLAYLAVTITVLTRPRSGPNYYRDMGKASGNSVQPKYRVGRAEAMRSKHALEVECFNDGVPYRISKLEQGQRMSSTYFLIDGYGRLRYVAYDGGWGLVQLRQMGPQPGTEN